MTDNNIYNPQDCGIYCWTNKADNFKKYVGQSRQLKRRKRRFLHFVEDYGGSYINRARLKYNSPEYWEYEVLEYCTIEELNEKEQFYIFLFNTQIPELGYNINSGGDFSEEGALLATEAARLKNMKPVYQIDLFTGEIIREWESASAAERELNIMSSSISQCCRGIYIQAGGFNWRFTNESYEDNEKKPRNKPVYQIDLITNEIIAEFRCPVEAGQTLNISTVGIRECCNGNNISAGGFKWQYKYDPVQIKEFAKKTKSVLKIDVNTDEVIEEFNSPAEAAESVNLCVDSIRECCCGRSITAGGFKWQYKDNPRPHVKKEHKGNKPVIQIDAKTEEVIKEWKSLKEAGSCLNINPCNISCCCNGRLQTAGGFKWRFKELNKEIKTSENKKSCKIPICQFTINNEFIREWPSATDAAKALNLNNKQISDCCRGKCKTAYGFKWKYKEPRPEDK